MSSLRSVGRSAATLDKDRKSLCRFTFVGGRQCRTPRSPHHPHFCSDHARKDSQARAADKLARELSYFFSGQYLSACDLSAALGRLLPAVVRGDIKPRSARTLAYLSQTLAQTIHLAEQEYINALGTDSWRRAIRNSVRQNSDYCNASPPPEPPPDQVPQPASQPAPSPHTLLPPTSNEFIQRVVAGLQTGKDVTAGRNLSRSEIPTLSGPGRETGEKSTLP